MLKIPTRFEKNLAGLKSEYFKIPNISSLAPIEVKILCGLGFSPQRL
jgi:hypothetical protein